MSPEQSGHILNTQIGKGRNRKVEYTDVPAVEFYYNPLAWAYNLESRPQSILEKQPVILVFSYKQRYLALNLRKNTERPTVISCLLLTSSIATFGIVHKTGGLSNDVRYLR